MRRTRSNARRQPASLSKPKRRSWRRTISRSTALLGIGGSRAPQDRLADDVRRLNALACPVLAIDVPSGLNVDTGQPYGADCVVATHTLSLLTLKPGLFTGAGRDQAGQVWFDPLGVEATPEHAPDAWLRGHPAAHRAESRVVTPRTRAASATSPWSAVPTG